MTVARRSWARWLLRTTVIAAVVIGGFLLWFAASLSGGFDNLLDVRHPEADDRRVVRAGTAALRALSGDGEDLARTLTAKVPGLGPVLGHTGATGCDEGQHNFKVDDDYDLRCTARHLVALSPRLDTMTEDLQAAEVALQGAGWAMDFAYPQEPPGGGLPVGGRLVAVYRRSGQRLLLRAVGSAGFYSGDVEFRELPPFQADDGGQIPAAELPHRAAEGHYTLLLELQDVYFDE